MQQQQEQDYTRRFDVGLWRRLIAYLKPYHKYLLGIMAAMCVSALCDVIFPLMTREALDNYRTLNSRSIVWFAARYGGIILVQFACIFAFCRLAGKAEQGINRHIRALSFKRLEELSFSYYDTMPVGYIISRMTSDTARLGETVAWALVDLFWSAAYIVITAISMFILNARLALLVLSVVPVIAVIAVWFQKRILASYRIVRKTNSQITGAFNEGITGAKTTKTLVIEDKVEREFDGLTGEMKRMSVRAMHFRSVFMSTTAFAASVALAIVLAGAAALVYGIISWRGGSDFGVYFALFGFAAVFFFSGAHVLPTAKNNRRAVERAWDEAQWRMSCPRIFPSPPATRIPSCSTA